LNNLSSGLQKSKEEIEIILNESEIELLFRAQNLSLEDWKKLLKKVDIISKKD
jgi:16S rRNA A1518/A1519 N6-dimethyltransferase RsmA/KsgA/DIM1 with predicted DNA glycosylase/AP lyase activity